MQKVVKLKVLVLLLVVYLAFSEVFGMKVLIVFFSKSILKFLEAKFEVGCVLTPTFMTLFTIVGFYCLEGRFN